MTDISKEDMLDGMCDSIIESLTYVIDGGRAKADYEVLHAALVTANALQSEIAATVKEKTAES